MATKGFEGPPLTEPVEVPCLFITGISMEMREHIICAVGWIELPSFGGETEERRIALRFALPTSAAQTMCSDLNRFMRSARRH